MYKKIITGAVATAVAVATFVSTAHAEDTLYIPALSY